MLQLVLAGWRKAFPLVFEWREEWLVLLELTESKEECAAPLAPIPGGQSNSKGSYKSGEIL